MATWLVPLAGALLMLAVVFHELGQGAATAPIINLAGRQRLLSQQLLAQAEAVHEGRADARGKLADLLAAFDRALDLLERGGEESGLSLPAAPAEVRPELDEVKRLWTGLGAALLTIARRSPLDAEARQAHAYVRANLHTLTQAADRLVDAFQRRALVTHRNALLALLAVGIVTCTVLLIGFKLSRDYIVERRRSDLALHESRERLQHLAHHDPVTGLPNRVLLADRLEQALARARWHKHLVAVLLLDLDRFKTINDTLGHATGDRLLKEVAERWQRTIRAGDTVARLGGDEFVIVLVDIAAEADVLKAVAKIVDALKEMIRVDGHEFFVSASIGISLHPADGGDSQTLLQYADVAMYRAKKGRNTYQFYSPALNAQAPQRLAMEAELHRALAQGEFQLHFQPIADLRTGGIIGAEALLRWYHPEKGIVAPAEFVPLLEETGLILPVGEWVIRNACTCSRAWRTEGGDGLRLAVNLSALQFHQQALASIVERVCTETGFDPSRLDIELTESMFLEYSSKVDEQLGRLRDIGANIVIDDFGTGYSSLNYLRRFPVSGVKIDGSFVKGMTLQADDDAIVRAIIALAHSLRIAVVAEGVETAEQLGLLRAADCDAVQGYLFSPPLPPEGFERLLQESAAEENLPLARATGAGSKT
jgi:diguanylate cyclase (GGDEF)-like protein